MTKEKFIEKYSETEYNIIVQAVYNEVDYHIIVGEMLWAYPPINECLLDYLSISTDYIRTALLLANQFDKLDIAHNSLVSENKNIFK